MHATRVMVGSVSSSDPLAFQGYASISTFLGAYVYMCMAVVGIVASVDVCPVNEKAPPGVGLRDSFATLIFSSSLAYEVDTCAASACAPRRERGQKRTRQEGPHFRKLAVRTT